MGIVAVRTLHQAFRYAVVLGQGKLRLHGLMAAKTKRGFGLLEQAVAQPAPLIGELGQLKEIPLRIAEIALARVLDFVHQVRGVALVTGNAMSRVFGMFKVLLLFAAGVTREAVRRVLFRRASKTEYRMFFERLGG